jgi:hypothetical protein
MLENGMSRVLLLANRKTKIEPYVIKQLLHLNLINMRLYGAEYNNIELGFASFIIVVLCFINQQYLSYIGAVSFIDGGTQSNRR